ncbi:sensor histidine kinase [Streptomyces sp. CA-142005]|uniref:sensor histidine kinase n=1 Tax=Streptomyces sp. CA-142005 TaxID=3240052 RepID=UPI003D90C78A
MYAVHRDLAANASRDARKVINQTVRQLENGTSAADVLKTATVYGVIATREPGSTGSSGSETATLIPTSGVPHDPVPVKVVEVKGQTATVLTAEGIYVLRSAPDMRSERDALRIMLWLFVPALLCVVALVAALTWSAMTRALGPVEAIRGRFAEITATNLAQRVPDPRSGDEISALAGTMNDTLDQLQRAVGGLRTFTSDASHELRSPLTTLRTRLELSLAHPATTDWPKTGDAALNDTVRLQEIVSDLLLLARLDASPRPAKTERIELRSFLADLISSQYPERPVVFDRPATDGQTAVAVVGNRSALTRLVTNLVDNALRHSASIVTVEITASSDKVTVTVADDGPGIPLEDRERVFERFTRLDDARTRDEGGSGLGLAIARGIAATHGGTLEVEPPLAEKPGARLTLTLPPAS